MNLRTDNVAVSVLVAELHFVQEDYICNNQSFLFVGTAWGPVRGTPYTLVMWFGPFIMVACALLLVTPVMLYIAEADHKAFLFLEIVSRAAAQLCMMSKPRDGFV